MGVDSENYILRLSGDPQSYNDSHAVSIHERDEDFVKCVENKNIKKKSIKK